MSLEHIVYRSLDSLVVNRSSDPRIPRRLRRINIVLPVQSKPCKKIISPVMHEDVNGKVRHVGAGVLQLILNLMTSWRRQGSFRMFEAEAGQKKPPLCSNEALLDLWSQREKTHAFALQTNYQSMEKGKGEREKKAETTKTRSTSPNHVTGT